MKLTLLSLLFFTSIAFSQPVYKKYYGSGGFSLNFMQSDELKSIIDQYNSNPAVVEKMANFDVFFGPNMVIGVNFDKDNSFLNFEFGFTLFFTSSKTSLLAQGTGRRTNQDVQIKIPVISAGLAYFLKAGDLMNLGAGINLAAGSMNVYARSYDRFTTTVDYYPLDQSRIFSYLAFNPSLYFNFLLSKNFTISLRPNYNLMLRSKNLSSLNSFLNGTTLVNQVTNSYFDGAGASLNFMFRIGD